jgi:hypothetical protein
MKPKLTYFYPLFLEDLEKILARDLGYTWQWLANGAISKARAEMCRRAISNYYDIQEDFSLGPEARA